LRNRKGEGSPDVRPLRTERKNKIRPPRCLGWRKGKKSSRGAGAGKRKEVSL